MQTSIYNDGVSRFSVTVSVYDCEYRPLCGLPTMLSLEFEDDQSTVFVDAHEVNETGLDRDLSPNQG